MRPLMTVSVLMMVMATATIAETDNGIVFIAITQDNVEALLNNQDFGPLLEGYLLEHHLEKDVRKLEDFPGKGFTIPVLYNGSKMIPVDHERIEKVLTSANPRVDFGFSSFVVDLIKNALVTGHDIKIDISGDILIPSISKDGHVRPNNEDSPPLIRQLISIQDTIEQEIKSLQGSLGPLKESFAKARKRILKNGEKYCAGKMKYDALLVHYKRDLINFEKIVRIIRPNLYANRLFNNNNRITITGDSGDRIICLSVVFGSSRTSDHNPMTNYGWVPVEDIMKFSPAH